MFTEIINNHEVSSDGITVWVNAPSGECVSRFGRNGVDVHRTIAEQEDGKGECLACTHGPVSLDDWQTFKDATLRFYKVDVPERHLPRHLRNS